MYELRAAVAGIVYDIPVDEGQLVAEEDVILTLESPGGLISLRTDVPGVVRELHTDVGDAVALGAVVALIDEA